MATKFTSVYESFLGRITDDMYMELTPEDTVKDLQSLLIHVLPEFEFPRKDLYNYTLETEIIFEDEIQSDDFVIGVVWHEFADGEDPDEDEDGDPDTYRQKVIVEKSKFEEDLTPEEINILAILMMIAWVQRQVTSIENTRMKYSGSDFKMTSQANHLQKLLALLSECQRQSFHLQRLYKRRRKEDGFAYESTWDWFGEHRTGNLR